MLSGGSGCSDNLSVVMAGVAVGMDVDNYMSDSPAKGGSGNKLSTSKQKNFLKKLLTKIQSCDILNELRLRATTTKHIDK